MPSIESNPFCSRFVRPGAIAYFFESGTSVTSIIAQLRSQAWRGEIVGPHGSGKSALLAALIPALEAAGRHVAAVELHDGQRRMPEEVYRLPLTPETVLVVDGCEQLSWWQRRKLLGAVSRASAGLVITTHRPLGLPPLCTVLATPMIAAKIAAHLQGDRPLITEAEVHEAFAANHGNLREMLFALYDLYRLRQHGGKT